MTSDTRRDVADEIEGVKDAIIRYWMANAPQGWRCNVCEAEGEEAYMPHWHKDWCPVRAVAALYEALILREPSEGREPDLICSECYEAKPVVQCGSCQSVFCNDCGYAGPTVRRCGECCEETVEAYGFGTPSDSPADHAEYEKARKPGLRHTREIIELRASDSPEREDGEAKCEGSPDCTSKSVRLRGWYSEEAGATVYGHYCDSHWSWSHNVPVPDGEPAGSEGAAEYNKLLAQARRSVDRYDPIDGDDPNQDLYRYWRGIENGLIQGWRLAGRTESPRTGRGPATSPDTRA